MRIDERLEIALSDSNDLRSLLLASNRAELASIRKAAAIEAGANPDQIAQKVELLIVKCLGNGGRPAPFLQLADWAAERIGAGETPQTIHDADSAILDALKNRAKPDIGNQTASPEEAQLLQIAISLAQLRQKKMRRLHGWQQILDQLCGSKESKSTPARDEKTAIRKIEEQRDETGATSHSLEEILERAGGRLPLSIWKERLTEARKEIGRFNIIVAGRTGVGKTTLIGAIFGHEIGNRLMGRPRTRGRIWYPLDPGEDDVLRLCDTEGLEMERYEETLNGLKKEIESRNASSDAFDHIHIAWLCIDEPSLTVQPGEEALVKLLAREGIPTIVVLTKAGMAPAFKETVEKLLPDAAGIIRVRAEPIVIEGQTFSQMGLNELMQATQEAIPNAVETAWHIASHNLKANLQRCEGIARKAAAAAGAAGATPIPLADAAGVFGVQVGMIIAISLNMGVKLKQADLRAMAVTLFGALGLTAGGRFIAGQFAKLIPGIGTIAGSAITGTTAGALTYGLGRAYIEYLRSFFEKHQRMPNSDELTSGFKSFWSRWKNKHQPPPETPSS